MINDYDSITAFAPATSANVAVGFDILGFAVADLGDEVILTKADHHQLRITSIVSKDDIPLAAENNTATVALRAMLNHLSLDQGFDLVIKKNIPLSSGLGGSAASSVAALVALNHLLDEPLTNEQLVPFALLGEEAACGAQHGDNVIPALFGGITLIQSLTPLNIIQLPLIELTIVLVHPHLYLDTREARAALEPHISLTQMTRQNAQIAAFISALYEKDYIRLAAACDDQLIEPMRAPLIPHFYEVKAAAYAAGALACSLSGSGPTLFAFAKDKVLAQMIADRMAAIFKKHGIESDTIITSFAPQGARLVV